MCVLAIINKSLSHEPRSSLSPLSFKCSVLVRLDCAGHTGSMMCLCCDRVSSKVQNWGKCIYCVEPCSSFAYCCLDLPEYEELVSGAVLCILGVEGTFERGI